MEYIVTVRTSSENDIIILFNGVVVAWHSCVLMRCNCIFGDVSTSVIFARGRYIYTVSQKKHPRRF